MQRASGNRLGQAVKRTLESLATDHAAFVLAGSVTGNAKKFNNVIRPQLLPIPVEDVCVPALHLDLGIFPYLFYAFVDELRRVDYKFAVTLKSVDHDSQAFKGAVEQFQEVISMEERVNAATREAEMYGAQVSAHGIPFYSH